MARLSIRHILLTGLVNPIVALLVLFLYWRGGHTGLARAFGTVSLLLLSLCLNFISCEWCGTHGWWWLLSPIAALVLLLVTARKPRIPRKAITGIVSLWILWLFILNPGISWVQDYNDGGVVAAAPVMAPPAAAAPAEPLCGAPTNLRYGDFNADNRALILDWDPPTQSLKPIFSYSIRTFAGVFPDGTPNWFPTSHADAGETTVTIVYGSNDKVDGDSYQYHVVTYCEGERSYLNHSEPSNTLEFTFPGGAGAAAPAPAVATAEP